MRYKHRDIDWLSFNERVLQEAEDRRNPLFERLKFLAIFSSNLDEFFRVRVSKLRQLKQLDKKLRKPLALKPNKTLKKILAIVDRQQERFGRIFYDGVKMELAEIGIHLYGRNEFKKIHGQALEQYFEKKIEALVEVKKCSAVKSEDFKDGQLYIVAISEEVDGRYYISVPTEILGRWVEISAKGNKFEYAFLEDVIKKFIDRLLVDVNVTSCYSIKLSRDAELYLEDDYEGEWVQQIAEHIRLRKEGQPTRLLYESDIPTVIQGQIRNDLNLGKADMVAGGNHHNFSDLFTFPKPIKDENLFFEPMPPLENFEITNSNNLFDLVRRKDVLLHFPYQRFGHLEDFLEMAAVDLNVTEINISLYRIAKSSRLTNALLLALENGKEVNIFVEAKARFDERNNIKWGRALEEKGGTVFYSFKNIKVHSKVLLITRNENGRSINYAYIGTGNFNSETSRIYCDHGLLTSNSGISVDLEKVFKVLRRETDSASFDHLIVSPFNSRESFEGLIENEIVNVQNNRPASITAKMNSLEDKQMIDLLCRAGQAGVKVKLLVRGFCCLVPGVIGLSENVEVISIVDRFLEHARVYLFENCGQEKMFIGSADWMTRNLDQRIEVIVPILDAAVFDELKDILSIQFADNVKARIIDKKSSNTYVPKETHEATVRSQYRIYNYLKKSNSSV